ncbi:glycosyl hydrolase [Microbacterium memoriense]|uniref:Glycosyl hydrolase n=1 Tax=Microbacterium memoriense TaxID=2978350 RepID=A0ABT2PBQ4_9MICO|nr:glycosyl hydrolase [Microbacterium memoriense]MCT9001991.1 glycosyl hydrolase [Microbacterium memoriense]
MSTHAFPRRLVCLSLLAVLALTACTAPAEEPAASSSPTPTAQAPQPVELPRVALARAGVGSWSLADGTALAAVLPEVGDAAAGSVALRIDAPVVDAEAATAAQVTVAAAPGDSLDVSFQVRALTSLPAAVPAAVIIAGKRIDLPELSARWVTVEEQLTVPADATEVTVQIVVDAAVSGVSFDDFSVTGSTGGNLVPNPSFEETTASAGIVSDSLVMNTGTAAVAVALAPGAATWTAQRGDEVIAGEATLAGAVSAVPLAGIQQGYFDFTVTDSVGSSITTPIAVVDAEGYGIAPDSRFGVGLHVENEIYAGAARYAGSLGLAEARNDILWHLNEKVRGQYDWDAAYVREFTRLHVNGLKVMGIVNYGNTLYGSTEVTPDNDEAIAAYGRYAAAIAQRFDLVGLEVFNEFNHERFNKAGCGTAPSCYVPLLRSVHDNVRAVAPDLPIVAGSTANYDAPWFDGLWQAGGMDYADAASYHPYQIVTNPTALADIIATSRASMQAYSGRTIPIWITELGSPSKSGTASLIEQSDFAFKASVTALGNNVEKFFWYDLINDSPDPAEHEGNFGLFFQPIPGVTALPPKPAAMTVALVINNLAGKDLVVAEQLSTAVASYAFGAGDDLVTFAWAPSGPTTVSMPASGDVQVTSADGRVTTVVPVAGVAEVQIPQNGVILQILP